MEMRLRTPVTRGYFFLVNATSPPTISIDKKKYPLEPRVRYVQKPKYSKLLQQLKDLTLRGIYFIFGFTAAL